MKVRKKPIVVDAYLWTGNKLIDPSTGERSDITVYPSSYAHINATGHCYYSPKYERLLEIHTREGVMHAYPGDYIIRGVQDEIYPIKPDIFEETYEKVKEDDDE